MLDIVVWFFLVKGDLKNLGLCLGLKALLSLALCMLCSGEGGLSRFDMARDCLRYSRLDCCCFSVNVWDSARESCMI